MAASSPDPWEVLKFDYEQTGQNFQMLADIRFRLLALVPTVTGTAVALLQNASLLTQIAVSALGLTATLGIIRYELRNTQLYDSTLQRLRTLEVQLGFQRTRSSVGLGGVHSERPPRDLKFLGLDVIHDRGLAFVYAAALGGWAFTLSDSLIGVANVAQSCSQIPKLVQDLVAVVFGSICGCLTINDFKRIDVQLENVRQLRHDIRDLQASG